VLGRIETNSHVSVQLGEGAGEGESAPVAA